jgi:hypothetical protein
MFVLFEPRAVQLLGQGQRLWIIYNVQFMFKKTDNDYRFAN